MCSNLTSGRSSNAFGSDDAGQSEGDGPAEAACGTGDEGRPAGKVEGVNGLNCFRDRFLRFGIWHPCLYFSLAGKKLWEAYNRTLL